MKKSIVLFLALCLIFMLTACTDSEQQPAAPPPPVATPDIDIPVTEYEEEPEDCEPYEEEEENDEDVTDHRTGGESLGLTITRLEYGDGPGPLEHVTFTHMLDYSELRGDAEFGDTLMIQTYTPLRDFAVINMSNDALNDEIIFFPLESFGTVENFLPGEAFIIHSYMGVGTLPWSGITFLDENGQRHYFAIIQNQVDGEDPYFLLALESRDDHLVVSPR
ncbi:MAG: hypothetical protein FWD99_07680 [Oscillospiraceae bacterium]|nr:hypothetical protein [Oscillospiraceae bacterium]